VSASKIIPHAKAIAIALGADMMLVHALETHSSEYVPADPVEWECSRREAEAFVSKLSKEHSDDECSISTRVLQGRTSEQISSCVTNGLDDIAVLCRSGVDAPGRLGQTARNILENVDSSVLLVPANTDCISVPPYHRVLLPLDGSSRAEGAIAVAMKIARSQHAEIVLANAVPEPGLLAIGPLEADDIELKNRLQRRNELVAHQYLARQCEQIRSCGVAARPVVVVDGDARRQLNRAIANESADLVVISSYGNGGHADASVGDTAIFLLANSPVPVLMIRRNQSSRSSHVYFPTQSYGVRHPTGVS
jgi:nucleotide-binding universal stress UspA family protein